MNQISRDDRQKRKRALHGKADKALHDLIKAEHERGEVNTGAEPDQKSDVEKPRDTD